MSIVSRLKGNGASGFGYGSTAAEVTAGLDLSGKTYLITGANSGLGLETARVLAMRGANLVAAARTMEKAEGAVAKLEPGEHLAIACELSEPDSVRNAVADVIASDVKLDGIICNAGIMALPALETKYGYELQFLTNHLGHFILVTGVMDVLADDGRVVMVSSEAHRSPPSAGIAFDNLDGSKGYQPWLAYGQSKLANLLMARELARRFEGSKRTANALHPGVIHTNLGRHSRFVEFGFALLAPLVLKSIPQGAATQTYVATHPDAGHVSGEYFSDCNVARSTKKGADMVLARRLWDVSEGIVAEL